mmetsp:Transcript_109089/g.336754  ORF Transcript_109089/g.336754 Transcript_109089/m.336754 type:complete len:248 (-) Transcript_109089:1000-1743(-)
MYPPTGLQLPMAMSKHAAPRKDPAPKRQGPRESIHMQAKHALASRQTPHPVCRAGPRSCGAPSLLPAAAGGLASPRQASPELPPTDADGHGRHGVRVPRLAVGARHGARADDHDGPGGGARRPQGQHRPVRAVARRHAEGAVEELRQLDGPRPRARSGAEAVARAGAPELKRRALRDAVEYQGLGPASASVLLLLPSTLRGGGAASSRPQPRTRLARSDAQAQVAGVLLLGPAVGRRPQHQAALPAL